MIGSLAQEPVRPFVIVEIPNAGDARRMAPVIVCRTPLSSRWAKSCAVANTTADSLELWNEWLMLEAVQRKVVRQRTVRRELERMIRRSLI